MDLGIYEFECIKCGARFCPPEELSTNISDVRKFIPKRLKALRKHALVVGKPIEYEEELVGQTWVFRVRKCNPSNQVLEEWLITDTGLKPLRIQQYEKYLERYKINRQEVLSLEEYVEVNKLKQTSASKLNSLRLIRTQQLRRSTNHLVIFANKDERKIEITKGCKCLRLKTLDTIDVDGQYCLTWTIEADDFEEIPMRAIVEGSEEEGWIRLRCPECGEIAFEWKN